MLIETVEVGRMVKVDKAPGVDNDREETVMITAAVVAGEAGEVVVKVAAAAVVVGVEVV
jgi:hypothetical protein